MFLLFWCWQTFLSENGKSLFKTKTNYLCYRNFYIFSSLWCSFIALDSFSFNFGAFLECRWNQVIQSVLFSAPLAKKSFTFNYFWKLIPSCRVLQGVQLTRRDKLRSRLQSRKWPAVLWLKDTNSVNCFRTLLLQLYFWSCANPKVELEGRWVHIYILFDGFTYNTRGYFASCVVFFRAPEGRGKIRAMSKMSASIICETIE